MIYLLGGGKGFRGEIGDSFLDNIGSCKSVCFIPTTPEDMNKTKKYKNLTIDWFNEIGIKFEKVDLINKDDTEEVVNIKVQNKDIIYLMGGDPISQLKLIHEKNMTDILKEFKGTIIGISAGALSICTKTIITKDEDFDRSVIMDGINLTNGLNVEVHFHIEDDEKVEELKKITEKNEEIEIYAIPENCALIINDGKIRVVGDKTFYIFKNGEMKRFD